MTGETLNNALQYNYKINPNKLSPQKSVKFFPNAPTNRKRDLLPCFKNPFTIKTSFILLENCLVEPDPKKRQMKCREHSGMKT